MTKCKSLINEKRKERKHWTGVRPLTEHTELTVQPVPGVVGLIGQESMRPGVQGPLPCAAALHGAGTCIGYVVVQ